MSPTLSPATKLASVTTETRAGYMPTPYKADAEDTVECPHCGRGNAADANYCDQCDTKLEATQPYARGAGENVECPECELYNDADAHFCDQCGEKLEGRSDVEVDNSGITPETPMDEATEAAAPTMPSGLSFNSKTAPRSNLVRDYRVKQELRFASDGAVTELAGIFAEYNTPYEIFSMWEGEFVEIMAPGCFADTMAHDVDSMRCLYDHGFDPFMGNKPIGPIRSLMDSLAGPAYVVPFLDTDYNRGFLIPALEGRTISGEKLGSVLGASMRFESVEETWNYDVPMTSWNPRGLPVRTITKARVFEFGPVTFPANPGATAFARSRTLDWLEKVADDQETMFVSTLKERIGTRSLQQIRQSIPAEVIEARRMRQRQAALRRRAQALLVTSLAS
jgi:phage head maturation protease